MSSTTSADTEPPVIQINGENPATIHVGDTYNDLGATITAPDADKNLGIKTFLNGKLVSNIVLDTTHVVTDPAGQTVTSTRNVLIEASDAAAESTGSPPVLSGAFQLARRPASRSATAPHDICT